MYEEGHLVCPELERRVSLVCHEGLEKYPDENVVEAAVTTARHGLPKYNLIKGIARHWRKYRRGAQDEDHLAKVAWGIQELMHAETLRTDNPCCHIDILLDEDNRIKEIPEQVQW